MKNSIVRGALIAAALGFWGCACNYPCHRGAYGSPGPAKTGTPATNPSVRVIDQREIQRTGGQTVPDVMRKYPEISVTGGS